MRRVRLTIRCLEEDFGRSLPGFDETLEDLEDDLLDEVRRIAPESPKGQKRILSIEDPPVFRVQKGRLRGATWVDEDNGIVWLLASELREEGSPTDAFEYFESLHKSGRLLPTDDDLLRDRAEAAARFRRSVRQQVPDLIASARARTGSEVRETIGGAVEVVLLIDESEDLQEVWLAVDRRVPERAREAIFVEFEQALEVAEWEWRSDWPTRPLEWFEIARLAVREATS